LSAEPTALLALAALLFVPGLLAARAPLRYVPALSASFWIVSSWWLPADLGRERVLRALLVGGGVVALLRVRDVPRRPPRLRIAAVAAIAVFPLALTFTLTAVPEASFSAISATLVVWNDGIPSSFQPLLDLAPFGADGPGLATLSADVALLSGLPPPRAVLLVGLASHLLVCLHLARRAAAHGAARPWPPARLAGILILLAAAAGLLMRAVLRGDPMVLALGLALSAVAIFLDGDSRLRAAAAGLVLAGCLLSHTATGVAAIIVTIVAARPWTSARSRTRVVLALGLAFIMAAPQIRRLGSVLSTGDISALFRGRASDSCPGLPWIYRGEASASANACTLTSFDK
jgi:hypothetical protein